MTRSATIAVLAVLALGALAGCAVEDDDEAADKAAQLVTATRAAGLAPRLTADIAESLYGDDAPAVCDVFDDDLGSAARMLLLGNPSGRRAKSVTSHSVEYLAVVVEVYCPEHTPRIRDELDELDPLERDG